MLVLVADGASANVPALEYRPLQPFDIAEIRTPVIHSHEQIRAARLIRQAALVVADADRHGLDSDDYGKLALGQFLGDLLDREMQRSSIERAKDYARRALHALALDLTHGRSKPGASAIDHMRLQVELAMEQEAIVQWYQSLYPQHQTYAALQARLEELVALQAQGGWVAVGPGATLALGATGDRVTRLRQRLGLSGEEGTDVFDLALQRALVRYQQIHGLDADGKAGRRTVEHLDATVAARILQVKLNLQRWREMPVPSAGTYVHVNIPEYTLNFVRHGRVELSMRVIVGEKDNPTPAFKDSIEYLIFNPYWDIPRRIAMEEMLPKIVNDPDFLRRQRLEVFDKQGLVAPATLNMEALRAGSFPYKLRQKPGRGNSLGDVKFIFPNQYNVYLHDTPADGLFDRTRRALSHGCIRLEEPEALAAALLANQGDWTPDRVSAVIGEKNPDYVALAERVPVILTYLTATASNDGHLRLLEDIYTRDYPPQRALASAALTPFPVVEQLRVAAR